MSSGHQVVHIEIPPRRTRALRAAIAAAKAAARAVVMAAAEVQGGAVVTTCRGVRCRVCARQARSRGAEVRR